MHMADALLSPAVGGTMWAATAVTVAYCSRRLRQEADDRRVPLMGVLGAFVFAAQMINFTIPGTGSSGHLGGGLLLAILLGPHAAFLVMASVLIVQALFFADGGLLALGCNIFNLGFFPAFVGYPLYRRLAGEAPGTARATVAAVLAAVVSLQLGAFAVVLQTVSLGHLGAAVRHVRRVHAADPSRDRHRRGCGHRCRHLLRSRCTSRHVADGCAFRALRARHRVRFPCRRACAGWRGRLVRIEEPGRTRMVSRQSHRCTGARITADRRPGCTGSLATEDDSTAWLWISARDGWSHRAESGAECDHQWRGQ